LAHVLKTLRAHHTNLFAFFTAHRKNLEKFPLRLYSAAADLFMFLKLWIGERQIPGLPNAVYPVGEIKPLGRHTWGKRENRRLRPNPLCLVATACTGANRLYCHRTRCFRRSATFKNPGSDPKSFNLRLQAGNLRLEDGNLVFFLFYRVIYIGHCLGLTKREYINIGTIVNQYTSALVQSFTLVESACRP
jgi:hypothetical protein